MKPKEIKIEKEEEKKNEISPAEYFAKATKKIIPKDKGPEQMSDINKDNDDSHTEVLEASHSDTEKEEEKKEAKKSPKKESKKKPRSKSRSQSRGKQSSANDSDSQKEETKKASKSKRKAPSPPSSSSIYFLIIRI